RASLSVSPAGVHGAGLPFALFQRSGVRGDRSPASHTRTDRNGRTGAAESAVRLRRPGVGRSLRRTEDAAADGPRKRSQGQGEAARDQARAVARDIATVGPRSSVPLTRGYAHEATPGYGRSRHDRRTATACIRVTARRSTTRAR